MAMNDELNVMIYDPALARRMEEIFMEDISHSKKLVREELENRQWLHRVLGALLSPFRAWF
jgi:cardiolipin synthase